MYYTSSRRHRLRIAVEFESSQLRATCLNSRGVNPTFHSYSATPDHWLAQLGPKLIGWTSFAKQTSLQQKWRGTVHWMLRYGSFSCFPLTSHQPKVWVAEGDTNNCYSATRTLHAILSICTYS